MMRRRAARPVPLRRRDSTLPRQDTTSTRAVRAPFFGSSVADYCSRYWCVKFTEVRHAHENREMQRFCQWYAVRCKVIYLEHLPYGYGDRIRHEIGHRMGMIDIPPPAAAAAAAATENNRNPLLRPSAGVSIDALRRVPLPALFVNKKLVGDLRTMYTLEESARLKDVLQFGMMWHTRPDAGPDVHPQALPVPASLYGDEEMFRGTYRGSPMTAPVQELPKNLPYGSIVHGPGGRGDE